MDKVQQQLQEYRQRKLREEQENSDKKSDLLRKIEISQTSASNSSNNSTLKENSLLPERSQAEQARQRTWTEALTSFLIQLLFWLLLLLVAVKFEFGIVYCILTGFYVIWINLSRRRRAAGELSAYSVFNPNMERLPGTLTAEQFEAELLHRPM